MDETYDSTPNGDTPPASDAAPQDPAEDGAAAPWSPPTVAPPAAAPSWYPAPAPASDGGQTSAAQPGPAGAQPAWAPPPPPPGWAEPQGRPNPSAGWGATSGGWNVGEASNPYGDPTNAYGAPPNPYGAGGATGWGGAAGGGPAGPGGPGGAGGSGWGAWGGGPVGPPPGSQPAGWNPGWAAPRPPRPRRSLPSAVTALLLVVAVFVGLGIGHGVWRSTTTASVSSPPASSGNSGNSGALQNPFGSNGLGNGSDGLGNGSSSAPNSSAITAASAGLVDINTALSYQNDQAAGTGIVLTSDGIVLTNNHVISGATSVKVVDIANGKTYTGKVIGYDRTHDIAVVQMQNASGLTTAKIGDSSKVAVGDQVVGIGNAGGTGGTPSTAAGTVTALNQSITAQDQGNGTSEQLTGLIQTDANIQPGDSGGALVNSSGAVVGVDTAASSGFSFQSNGNQGFAIPIDVATSIANQIRSGQTTSTIHIGATAFLGVLVSTSASSAGQSGAALSSVVPGGPAAQAGLTGGDTITALGGKTVDSSNTLTSLIGQYHPGDSVSVGWVDSSGATHHSTIHLGTGPAA